MTVIDDLLVSVPPKERTELDGLRRIIKQACPEAEEVMTYGMPGFRYKNKYLISFASFKDHLSLFPTAGPVVAFKDQLGGYTLSKGTIQFKVDHPLPEKLVIEIVKHRMSTIDQA